MAQRLITLPGKDVPLPNMPARLVDGSNNPTGVVADEAPDQRWLDINSNFKDLYGGAGAGAGAALAYAPASGTVDPGAGITGFVAGLGGAGTGRLLVTLAAATTFEGLPAGVDGQTLCITVVAGAFALTLSHNNASTAGAEIFASADLTFQLGDTVQLIYTAGSLNKWMLMP